MNASIRNQNYKRFCLLNTVFVWKGIAWWWIEIFLSLPFKNKFYCFATPLCPFEEFVTSIPFLSFQAGISRRVPLRTRMQRMQMQEMTMKEICANIWRAIRCNIQRGISYPQLNENRITTNKPHILFRFRMHERCKNSQKKQTGLGSILRIELLEMLARKHIQMTYNTWEWDAIYLIHIRRETNSFRRHTNESLLPNKN